MIYFFERLILNGNGSGLFGSSQEAEFDLVLIQEAHQKVASRSTLVNGPGILGACRIGVKDKPRGVSGKALSRCKDQRSILVEGRNA